MVAKAAGGKYGYARDTHFVAVGMSGGWGIGAAG